MDRAELIRRLMATFLVELQDHLRVFNRELLALEQQPSAADAAESIKTLFRTVHSMKGAARSVDAQRLAKVCHELEEILAHLRDGTRALNPELFSVFFQAADAFEVAGKELAAGGSVANLEPLSSLGQRLDAMKAGARVQPPPPVVQQAPMAAAVAPPPALAAATPQPALAEVSARPLRTVRESYADQHTVVRVPVRRLDALLSQSGELSVARRRFEVRRDELSALHESVTHLRTQFRGFGERSLRRSARAATAPAASSGKAHGLLQLTAESLEHIETDLARLSRAIGEDVRNLERAAVPLEAQVHRVRMLAFGEACEGLTRALRDLAQSQRKDVELVIEGAEIELDRAVIEGARSALLHLVRNAIDHGIEPSEVRVQQGKPARARVVVRAALRGDRVEVSVADDGRGLDLAALREQAQRRGLTLPEDERELCRLIFRPGFSTARTITDVSGRGVGLDVVRTQIEAFRGEVDVSFEPGKGTRFTLMLPLTASTLRALLVGVGDQVFALPNSSVQALLRAGEAEVGRVDGREVLLRPDGPVPLASLRSVLGLTSAEPLRPDGKLAVAVIAADGRNVAITVDQWLNEQELMLKPLGTRVRRVRHVSAAALLPSGQLCLLLKVAELVRSAYAERTTRSLSEVFAPKSLAPMKRVLLADDSVTTRTLERSILEAAGYEVLPAADGEQAFKLLQENGADVVVSDVEMPRMNGFMLTEAIRASKRFRALPIVLLTALGSDEDRARGLQCGADAYLVKSAFDQDALLETLRQLA